ncbi:hypothetical protein H8959_016185 [Pygathrix nigripes]
MGKETTHYDKHVVRRALADGNTGPCGKTTHFLILELAPSPLPQSCFSAKASAQESRSSRLVYGILDILPCYLCIFLGIQEIPPEEALPQKPHQHIVSTSSRPWGASVAVPLILAKVVCLQHDVLTQGYLISTIFFISSICMLLQVFLGVRLPVLQGGAFAFVVTSLAVLSLPTWNCPEWTLNASQVNTNSPKFTEKWQQRIREAAEQGVLNTSLLTLQGAVMVTSCVQMLVGFSGLIGFLVGFIGPLAIAPTISRVALPLFDSAGNNARIHWGFLPCKCSLGRKCHRPRGHLAWLVLLTFCPWLLQVGSRAVIVTVGCVLHLMGSVWEDRGCICHHPTPVIGGMSLVVFGVITAMGISNLQYVDMNSSRSLCAFGFSIYCGLTIPNWLTAPGLQNVPYVLTKQLPGSQARFSKWAFLYFIFISCCPQAAKAG